MFALIDCQNFFVSCERVFQPNLNNKPVIVLSNNDGCAIARSEEAKAIGIDMGVPLFKIRDIVEWNKVRVFSSNFSLYGDMSRRVMDIIQSQIQDVEIYSVDEAFVEFPKHYTIDQCIEWSKDIRQKILTWTGIPTRVGIGTTKTLAKLGNSMAKQRLDGVMYVGSDDVHLFKDLPISKIWGYGRQYEKRLKRYAIHTVGQLLNRNREWVRKTLTVTGERTYYELKGFSCYPLTESIDDTEQKSMIVSRSFSEEVINIETLKDSITQYANTAGAKLRKKGLFTNHVGVFIRSSPFKEGYYSNFLSIELPKPTNDTRTIIETANAALTKIYKPDVHFKKSGLVLFDLSNTDTINQLPLITSETTIQTNLGRNPSAVMAACDFINQKYGRNTLSIGMPKLHKIIGVRKNVSPRYTTRWTELAKVK